MILLFLLPFYDRGPERRPERRPIATLTGIFVIGAMALLTYQGANAGSPTAIEMATPKAVAAGRRADARRIRSRQAVVAQSGCLACHKIGDNGNDGPGPELTHIALATAAAGDRAHAREPDRADALVQEPAAEEVQRGRRLPVAAEVAAGPACTSAQAPRAGDAGGGPGARDVRPHRRASTT